MKFPIELIAFYLVIGLSILGWLKIMGVWQKESFESKKEPTFVYYYKPWCKYCKAFMPVWDSFVKANASDFTMEFAKINIDDDANKSLAKKYGINSVPTLILHKNGKNTVFKGERSPENLKKFLMEN